ncbi:MAG: hypothetical protein L6R30_25615 [Thermoanaerobaculia bacterium]|nr:hypothetical protein [Thermoanaerobaculia bacterium]
MPVRLLRDWTDSEAVNSISPEAEVLFTRLIMKADDFGRYTADPRLLRPYLFPRKLDQIREVSLERWLVELESARLVRRYVVAGKPYLAIEKFGQRVRADASRFPDPPVVDERPPDDGHVTVKRQTDDRPLRPVFEDEDDIRRRKKPSPPDGSSSGLPFGSPDFREAWERFQAHRKEIKKPLRPTGERALLSQLATRPECEAIAALQKAMAAGWQGVFFERSTPAAKSPPLVGAHPPNERSWNDSEMPPEVARIRDAISAGQCLSDDELAPLSAWFARAS